jgi:hypothetical protein
MLHSQLADLSNNVAVPMHNDTNHNRFKNRIERQALISNLGALLLSRCALCRLLGCRSLAATALLLQLHEATACSDAGFDELGTNRQRKKSARVAESSDRRRRQCREPRNHRLRSATRGGTC